ncbi:J domain-containing protein [Glaciihabitans sp. INWT7]|uniref:J domain-containing protein n=1 Tax=Glaciihabitans sp. INWT7 TaxID=2596912 RepID=UPI001624E1EE|nr:J domain-containing protein [Glaciihabitans sp. INWT7]QNE46315.1 J domain-containing protein [Glaciihabitans sp. INWT7]
MTSAEAAQLLGVSAEALPPEIERAFKQRARMSHPDRFTGASPSESRAAAAEFIRVTEARNLLLRLAAERVGAGSASAPRITESLVYTSVPAPRYVPRRSGATIIWTFLLVVASVFCFIGGTLPLSPWNLLLLVPLDFCAIAYARTSRQAALVGTLVFGAINAAVAVTIASFGSLVALEILLAPVIALVVIGRSRRGRLPDGAAQRGRRGA